MEGRKRASINRSVVFDYWKDKSITETGEIVCAGDYRDKARLVVEDCGEPVCWACSAGFSPVGYTAMYDRLVRKGDLDSIRKIWDLPGVALERCHIIPFAEGGSDDPSNLFLLCPSCHKESPDTMDKAGFLRWVYNQKLRGPRVADGFFVRDMAGKLIVELRQAKKDPRTIRWAEAFQNTFSHDGRVMESSIVASLTASCDPLLPGMDFGEALTEFNETFEPGSILGELDTAKLERHRKRMEKSISIAGAFVR